MNYEQVKDAILRRYGVNEGTHRRRFRRAAVKSGETTRELAVRLGDSATKRTKGCKTLEELRDTIVLEQLLNTKVQLWVKEHKPKTSHDAAILADDYNQTWTLNFDVSEEITNAMLSLRETGTPREGL
jgi:hypothetical protein